MGCSDYQLTNKPTNHKQEEKVMNEETMMKEIKRIFDAALDARRKAARLATRGMVTPLSAYRCGQRDALDFVLEELAQTFGLKVGEVE